MRKKARIIVITLIALIVAGAFIAYQMWNKPHTQVEDVKAMPVTATELCRAFAENEAAAGEKYGKGALEVTGTVGDVSQNQDGFPIVVLHGEDGASEVSCTMREKDPNLSRGSTASIKGFFSASTLFGVSLTDCILVK